jgi:hypothetical protein
MTACVYCKKSADSLIHGKACKECYPEHKVYLDLEEVKKILKTRDGDIDTFPDHEDDEYRDLILDVLINKKYIDVYPKDDCSTCGKEILSENGDRLFECDFCAKNFCEKCIDDISDTNTTMCASCKEIHY